MAAVTGTANKLSAREAKRLQTRERLLGAAVAEFKRSGMAEADVAAIVAAAGVAHGTFFFHFPTKEHVLLELEKREEDRMAKQFGRFLDKGHDLEAALTEAVRLVLGLERRLGDLLFKDFLALHFSQTRPPSEDGGDHSLVLLLAQRLEQASERGEIAADVEPMNSAVFFLLGLYALAITTNDPMRRGLLEDLVKRSLRSIAS
ncbi:TetR family transcriptional regulator [Mycobacterium sp. C31M]